MMKHVAAIVLGLLTAATFVWALLGTVALIRAVIVSGGSWLHVVATLEHYLGMRAHVSADGSAVFTHSAHPVAEFCFWLLLAWALFGVSLWGSKKLFANRASERRA